MGFSRLRKRLPKLDPLLAERQRSSGLDSLLDRTRALCHTEALPFAACADSCVVNRPGPSPDCRLSILSGAFDNSLRDLRLFMRYNSPEQGSENTLLCSLDPFLLAAKEQCSSIFRQNPVLLYKLIECRLITGEIVFAA
jgi:hypothetical protein